MYTLYPLKQGDLELKPIIFSPLQAPSYVQWCVSKLPCCSNQQEFHSFTNGVVSGICCPWQPPHLDSAPYGQPERGWTVCHFSCVHCEGTQTVSAKVSAFSLSLSLSTQHTLSHLCYAVLIQLALPVHWP